MSFYYNPFKSKMWRGEINIVEAMADAQVLLVDPTSSAGSEPNTEFIANFTTLAELTGTNYARLAIANQVVQDDFGNNRSIFDGDDLTWLLLGADNAVAHAGVLFIQVTNDSDSIAMAYIDTGGFPIQPNGGDIAIQWNAIGIGTLT